MVEEPVYHYNYNYTQTKLQTPDPRAPEAEGALKERVS